MPFSRSAGECESSIIKQSMILQCLSRSQSIDELISTVAVTMIFRPQLFFKGIMKRKPLKKCSCFAMMHSWIWSSLSDRCRCSVASMLTLYSASCSVEMFSFRRLNFLSVCQSVCTPFLGLAEHSSDHVHWVVGLRLFNEAAWWSKEFRLMTVRKHLVATPTAHNSMLHACLLVICNLSVYRLNGFFAMSFFLKKFFMARLVRLFSVFHQHLCQCLKMENIIY